MASKKKRIILDTNIWISFLITKDLSKLDKTIFSGETVLIFSQELLEEFVAVVSRPKFKNLITKEDIINILEIIENEAEYVEVTSQLDLCRDKKDNFLLSLAVDSKADFLITGDEDLLELKQIDKTNIITIRDFLS